MKSLFVFLDKILDTIGQKKAQKGSVVFILTSLVLQFFPTFPQEEATKFVDGVVVAFNVLSQIWISVGILHQWVKDQLLKKDIIPPSVEKAAEAGQTVVLVKPN